MATKFTGVTNPTIRITENRTFDKRTTFGKVNYSVVEKIVDDKLDDFREELLNNINEDEPEDTPTPRKKRNGWRTSVQGVMILSRTALSSVTGLAEAQASTDKVATKKHMFHDAVSLSTMAIGTLGGPWGALIASAINTANAFFGTAISNSIQRSGDLGRTLYNFNNMDYQKYGTYAYNNTSGEWVAEDANKIKSKILNKNQSV